MISRPCSTSASSRQVRLRLTRSLEPSFSRTDFTLSSTSSALMRNQMHCRPNAIAFRRKCKTCTRRWKKCSLTTVMNLSSSSKSCLSLLKLMPSRVHLQLFQVVLVPICNPHSHSRITRKQPRTRYLKIRLPMLDKRNSNAVPFLWAKTYS